VAVLDMPASLAIAVNLITPVTSACTNFDWSQHQRNAERQELPLASKLKAKVQPCSTKGL